MADITRLLQQASAGETLAGSSLYALVYEELRGLARRSLAREGASSELDASGLVHEAWLRLNQTPDLSFDSRRAFFAYAAQVMRSVLLDELREYRASKRGGERREVTLSTAIEDVAFRAPDLVAVDSALQALARLDARSHDVFEMHFFAGLGVEDICAQLALSPASVKRDLRKARAFIENELSEAGGR